MGQVPLGIDIPKESRFNFLVRQGVCFFTLAVHCMMMWGSSPLLLLLGIPYATLYPAAMMLNSTIRNNNRIALGLDSVLYGFLVGLWGFPPMLVALYLSAVNVVNMAAGGPQFCLKGLLFFTLASLLGFGLSGFEIAGPYPTAANVLAGAGLVFFLSAFGLRVHKINARLRQTRTDLNAQKEELTSINTLASAVNSHLEIDILLEKIMHTIEHIYPFEALYIVRFDEEIELIEVAGIYGSSITMEEHGQFRKLEFDMERDKHSLFVRSLAKQKVSYIPEITPELVQTAAYIDRQLFSVKPSVSLAYFPVYVKDKVVAGACFINYEKNFYLEQYDMDKIQDFLIQVGTAIRNATLFNELIKAKEDADIARQKAETSEEAKSRFLANMSHEIRTPLTAIMGYAEALQEDEISETERNNFIGYIQRSGKHLLSMINDILDISKIEASKIEVERINFNYFDILYEIDSYVKTKCKDKAIRYSLDIHYPIPKTLIIDPTRLKQILFNLCNNAIKFTEAGSISFSVNTDGNSIEFRVADTGIGISTEEQERIFSAFDQADSSTTRIFGGTGLGLYISKNLSELLGGKLRVESVKGVGSTFILQLPFVPEPDNQVTNIAQFQQIMEEVKGAKDSSGIPALTGTVLLAEDNEDNQQLITRLVKLTGLDIDCVDNGELAVKATKNQTFDLILMDMQMPVMGGKEATTIIKEHGVQTPIVAFTANVMKHQMDEYRALGFSAILEKPIDRQKLFNTLETQLKHSTHRTPPNVLVVEDNEVNLLILCRYVNKANETAKVDSAVNGQEAIEKVQTKDYDLILMDMEMPILGGLEATKSIREMKKTMPIFIVTGNIGRETHDQCLSAGANGHITKPVDKTLIHKTIVQALHRRPV